VADAVAIVSVVSSGAVTPTIVALYALQRQRRDHARDWRDARLAIVEEGTAALLSARRMLADEYALWRTGVPQTDELARNADQAVRETREGVWVAASRVGIRFGLDSDITLRYGDASSALTELNAAVRPYRRSATHDEAAHRKYLDAFRAARKAHRQFVIQVHQELVVGSSPTQPDRREERGPWVW
jgi:hypothetical protein